MAKHLRKQSNYVLEVTCYTRLLPKQDVWDYNEQCFVPLADILSIKSFVKEQEFDNIRDANLAAYYEKRDFNRLKVKVIKKES